MREKYIRWTGSGTYRNPFEIIIIEEAVSIDMSASIGSTNQHDLKNFWVHFNSEIVGIKNLLEESTGSEVGAEEKITEIRNKISLLQKYSTESTRMMPPYDIKRSQEEIEKLNKEFKILELKLKPKKKFTFGSRSAAPVNGTSTVSVEKSIDALKPVANDSKIKLPLGSVLISDTADKEIILVSELKFEMDLKAQLLMKNCCNCVISARSVLGSVRLESMSNCRIYLGPCCTSVYLESCSNCEVYIACHQLRIHKCVDCSLYVRCNSHPIIEDCTHVGFAPYSLTYAGIEEDYVAAGLIDAHHWDDVVDFRWHKSTKSPNWYIIPSENIPVIVGVFHNWSSVSSKDAVINIEVDRNEELDEC